MLGPRVKSVENPELQGLREEDGCPGSEREREIALLPSFSSIRTLKDWMVATHAAENRSSFLTLLI